MKIKLLIVDLYGVITTGSYRDTCRWIAKKYHLDYSRVYDIVYNQYFNQAAEAKITERQSFAYACRDLELPLTWRQLRQKHLSFQKLNWSVLRFFTDLQKKGYKVILFSKNTPGQFSDTVRQMKLRKYFKNIINSHTYKLAKSSPKMIRLLLKRFKSTPKATLQIDDQGANLETLRKMGGMVIAFKNLPQLKKDLKKYS